MNAILALQARCLISVVERPVQSGFLITAMSPEELDALIVSGSRLVVARRHDAIVGYTLTCPSDYLHDLAPRFVPARAGVREDLSGFQYLFQIAVDADWRRRGIALELMAAARRDVARGLVADVLLEPIENAASLSFFRRAGFEEIGSFTFDAYPGIGPHRSAVFLWQAPAC